MNIYEKMAIARCELKNKEMKKSERNPFAKFTYFELSDFIPYVLDILEKHKICSRFNMSQEEAHLEFINAEKPEEKIDYTAPIAKIEMKGCTAIQGIGAVITYMRRYLYMMAFEIVEADMLDAVVDKEPSKKRAVPQFIEKEVEDIDEIVDSLPKRRSFDVIINEIKDIVSLNKAFSELKTYATNDWKRPLNEVAKKLGCVFNSEKGLFLAA